MKKFLLLIIATLSISLTFGQITSTTSGGNGNLKNIGAQEGVNADDFLNTTLIGWQSISKAYDVDVSGDYAYVAAYEEGLRIIDISIENNPIEIGYLNFGFSIKSIVVNGNYAYLAAYGNGLRIVDISDVTNPIEVGYYKICWDSDCASAFDVAVSGNYAYVAFSSTGLRIIDISDVANPTLVGSYTSGSISAWGVTLYGDYVYVGDRVSGMHIIDVSDATSPIEVGSIDGTDDEVVDIAISGNYAFLANDGEGLRIIDISDVTGPIEVGNYDPSSVVGHGNTIGVKVLGDYAYISAYDLGLRIIDITDVTNPLEVGFYDFDTTGGSRRLDLVSGKIYIVNENGLYIISNDLLTASTGSTLNGKITNAVDGTPISGALVGIASLSTTTDAEGNYEITDIPEATLNAVFSGTPLSGAAPLEVSFTDQSNDAAHTLVISAT